ncbi:MAG: ABC-type multidrug transport system, ATPase and permease component [Candidatus Doudnabacteria bacterium]|nr:ABC-type multidrug transport system, ATPase and permease component [Candidatus Doudnabacteria bacterium]
MRILFSYLKHYWKLLILALFLATINQVFSLLDPYIFRKILDQYVTKFDQFTPAQFFHGVIILLGAAIGVAFVSRVAKNFQDYYTNTITQRLGAEIYTDGLAHSLELPYQVFEDQRSGETLGKLQKVRLDVQTIITAGISVLFISLVGFTFVGIYAVRINGYVALAYLLTIPIIGGLSYLLSKKIKKIQQRIVSETNALSGSTTESLRNIELVKSLGLADQEITRLNGTTKKILELELQKVKYLRSLSFIQGTVVNLTRTIILFLMLYLIFAKRITFGQFFSLYIYSFTIFAPLQELGNLINTYRESEVSLDNFKKILDTPKELTPENPVEIGEVKDLEFKDVTFKHLTANTNALSDVSFKTKIGETIAFVGPSGSGKTTLVKLLVGLYQPLAGAVLYNHHPGNAIDLNKLRVQIGLVTQDAQLFAGTIRENLLFANPKATDAEVHDVLHKAAADSLLARADKGLDTVIGEGGVKVSGGEKQRLSIARALLRHPNILVFDEATSALDSITEEEISKTIRDVSTTKEHMTVLIAHRLSTIMHADRIFVLEKGQIVESGKHQELLDQKGLYYAMWRQQIGER